MPNTSGAYELLSSRALDLASLGISSNRDMSGRIPIDPNEMLGCHLGNILDGHADVDKLIVYLCLIDFDKLIRNGILKMKFETGYPDGVSLLQNT